MRDWSPLLGLPLWVWIFVLPSLFALLCLAFSSTTAFLLKPIWRLLDFLYLAAGVIAAIFMVMILLLIVSQMVARWTSVTLPGTTEFSGYAMAITSFFALAHALTRGAHIRVSILLNFKHRFSYWLDTFALLLSALIATYFARFAVKTNIFSKMLNDRTQGQDQIPEWLITLFTLPSMPVSNWSQVWEASTSTLVYTPIWLPQLAMSAGTILLAIALWDTLYRTLINGKNPITVEGVQ